MADVGPYEVATESPRLRHAEKLNQILFKFAHYMDKVQPFAARIALTPGEYAVLKSFMSDEYLARSYSENPDQ